MYNYYTENVINTQKWLKILHLILPFLKSAVCSLLKFSLIKEYLELAGLVYFGRDLQTSKYIFRNYF